MADVKIEHTYNCNEDTFWDKIFFESDYNEQMFKKALEFPGYEVADQKEDDSSIRRSINVVPKLGPMPGPVKKLIGDGLGYREDGVYDKKSRRYTIKITPNKLADKIKIEGVLYTKPAGDNKLSRVFECKVEVKIFGVGGLVEKQVIGDMETSYAKGAEFTNKYIAEKGL
ncbi:MAG: DUF2505 family protein [Polyangiaceae bacterium]